MAIDDYPEELKLGTWEKKKGALPPRHALGEALKALQRKHDAIDWKKFAPAAAKAAKSAAEVDKLWAAAEAAWGGPVAALKKEALSVAGDAADLATAKGAEKAQVEAGKSIAAAAKAFAKAFEAALGELETAVQAARAAHAAAEDDEEDAPPSALLDPKKLLAALQAAQRNPSLRLQFAFVDANEKEKKPPSLAMHPKNSGRGMFAKLQEATGVKAGAHGSAWIDDKTLILQVEKAFSGLVKKARLPIKTAGFRIARIVLWAADGSVLEQDQADDDAAPAAAAGGEAAGGNLAAAWERLKAELSPEIRKAIEAGGPQRAELAALAGAATAAAKGGDFAAAIAAFRQAQALLRPAAAPAAVDGPAFQAQLKKLAPAIAALTARRPDAAKLVAEISALAKAQDFGAAAALLAKLEPLLGSGATDDFPTRWRAAREAWQDASDLVDNQIGKLQAALREQTDAELTDIAEFGLNAVTGGHKVPLMAALREIGSGESVEPAQLAEARQAVDDFLTHLNADPRVAACDENPFGVAVSLRATLGGALERLAATLER